jgi:hypothetical protein
VTRPSPKPLNATECRKIATLVDLGKAYIVKEFKNGKPTLVAFSKSGAPLGTPDKHFAHLLESKLATNGAGDGLFPGCDQTTRPNSETAGTDV